MPVCGALEDIIGDPTIDLVLVLTPPFTHLDLVRRCAEAGKHVLLEKPIEGTLERSRQLVRLCRAHSVRLGIVFQNRFRTPHLRLRELIGKGVLGDPISVSLAVRWWRPDSYFQEPGRGIKSRDGGGVMLTQAIHMMDQMVDLLGAPQSVTAFASTSKLRQIDTEDAVAAALRWTGGAIGVLDATTTRYPTTGEQLDIAAEQGTAVLERTRLRVWLKDGQMIDMSEDPNDPAVAGDYLAHRRLLEDMCEAIEQHRDPLANGEDSMKVHVLIDALLKSASTGQIEALT
jgi:predicted dehydrogenase